MGRRLLPHVLLGDISEGFWLAALGKQVASLKRLFTRSSRALLLFSYCSFATCAISIQCLCKALQPYHLWFMRCKLLRTYYCVQQICRNFVSGMSDSAYLTSQWLILTPQVSLAIKVEQDWCNWWHYTATISPVLVSSSYAQCTLLPCEHYRSKPAIGEAGLLLS